MYTRMGLLVGPIFGEVTLGGNEVDTLGIRQFFYWLTANCSTVRQFWGQHWNLPVHTMLVEGVYVPVKKWGLSTAAASMMVFLVSGLGHVYSLNALACPVWTQLCMMVFFAIQPAVIAVEKNAGIKHPAFVFFALSLLMVFFVEPLLYVVGYGFLNLD